MVSAWLPSSVHNGVARLARVVGEEVESKLSRCNSQSESEVGSKTFVSHHRPRRVQISFIIMKQTSQSDFYFSIFPSHRLALLPSLWILLLYSRLSIISSELRPLLLPSTHICPSDCNKYWRSRPKKNKNILPVGSVNTTQSGLISYLAGHNGTDRSLNIPHRRDFFVCIKFLKYPKNSFLILIRSIRESVKRKFQSFYGLNL